jgi:hypothetical protein
MLPGMVCPACVTTAMVSAPFVQQCRAADQKWRQITEYLTNMASNVSHDTRSACVLIKNDDYKTIESVLCVKTTTLALSLTKSYIGKVVRKRIKGVETDLKCPECEKVYPTIYAFNAHLKDIDKKMCQYCKEVISLENFVKHSALHGAQVHSCRVCKSMFRSKMKLSKHMKTCKKKGPHGCVECSQSFLNATNLATHYASKHNTKVCSACDKKFVSRVCFKNHSMLCHNSKAVGSKFICDYCSKEYKFKNALRLHIRFKHLVGWEYQCHQCGKKFSNPAHLKEHDNTHNRVDDRYVCSICGAKYSTRRGYERHYKRHFDDNGDVIKLARPQTRKKRIYKKLFHCIICNYVTGVRQKLEKHLKAKHNIVSMQKINS